MSHAEKEKTPDHLEDCQKLSATALRKRYPAEANSHRNLLQRAKTQGKSVHPEFGSFCSFLEYVGPQPCRRATLDRIDNADPEYAPGKVRWADKRTQNSNKGDTLLFHYSRTGENYTVSRLAKLHKVSPSSIRKRLERGWTDDQIIEGKRHVHLAEVHRNPTSAIPRPRVRSPRQAPENAATYIKWRRAEGRVPPSDLENDAGYILWQRHADLVAHTRREEGQEYCIAPP
jgi:hypothetical protein